jgi:transposase
MRENPHLAHFCRAHSYTSSWRKSNNLPEVLKLMKFPTSGSMCSVRGGDPLWVHSRRPRCDNRRFVDALLWMARSGGRWRDLPERLGDHQAVKRRYYRWIERGALDKFLEALTMEADLEWLMIDSTIVRAHQHGAGARISKGGRMPRVWADPAAA